MEPGRTCCICNIADLIQYGSLITIPGGCGEILPMAIFRLVYLCYFAQIFDFFFIIEADNLEC